MQKGHTQKIKPLNSFRSCSCIYYEATRSSPWLQQHTTSPKWLIIASKIQFRFFGSNIKFMYHRVYPFHLTPRNAHKSSENNAKKNLINFICRSPLYYVHSHKYCMRAFSIETSRMETKKLILANDLFKCTTSMGWNRGRRRQKRRALSFFIFICFLLIVSD
jgi:hypothetical protein